MEPPELDDVDRGILHMLQQDARNNTTSDIADAVGVAPNTVRNRLDKLEENGVINGYVPDIDYEQAGLQLRVLFVCTVSVSDRNDLAEKVLDINGVIRVTETLSGNENLAVEAVAASSEDLTSIASALEALGLDIRDEWFIKTTRVQPFNHFGIDDAAE